MSLPTPVNLKTMDYSFQGQPFVDVPAKDGLNLKTMDYSFQGQPFVSNPDAVAPPSGDTSAFLLFFSFVFMSFLFDKCPILVLY
jgi:hypothetical protein